MKNKKSNRRTLTGKGNTLKLTRKFNGKIFSFVGGSITKEFAIKRAKQWKAKGYKVRITKAPKRMNYAYEIWASRY